MAVVSMSKQEFSRLDVLLRVRSGRLRVADACALMGLHRRQVSAFCVISDRMGSKPAVEAAPGKGNQRTAPSLFASGRNHGSGNGHHALAQTA
jgi:hypothetical protein